MKNYRSVTVITNARDASASKKEIWTQIQRQIQRRRPIKRQIQIQSQRKRQRQIHCKHTQIQDYNIQIQTHNSPSSSPNEIFVSIFIRWYFRFKKSVRGFKKKAFSSEFDAGDDGTIKIEGPKFLSGPKWPKFVP